MNLVSFSSYKGDEIHHHSFTCPSCHFRPDKRSIDDYVTTGKLSKRSGELSKRNLKFPVRCTPCGNDMKRYSRMKNRVQAIFDRCFSQKMGVPAVITITLPSEWNDRSDSSKEVKELLRLMPKARKIMKCHGIMGGSFVIECTYRSLYEYRRNENYQKEILWKKHAHSHMVAVGPYVDTKNWDDWCRMLEPLGLGRMWYEKRAPKCQEQGCESTKCRHQKDWKKLRNGIAAYISKYITKEAGRCRTWGVMRNTHTKHNQQEPK